MKDPLLPLLHRLVADRTPSTRKELVSFSTHVLSARFLNRAMGSSTAVDREDLDLLVIMLLLRGDEVEDVAQTARNALETSASIYMQMSANVIDIPLKTSHRHDDADVNMDIVDGEEELRKLTCAETSACAAREGDAVQALLGDHMSALLDLLIAGVESWTVDGR